MIGNQLLTYGLGAALVAVSAGALIDGISNRVSIRNLESARTELREDLKTANQNIGTCHSNFRTVELAVTSQGKDIRALADSSQKNADESARRLAALEKQTKSAATYAKATLDLPRLMQPAPADACGASVRLLRGGVP
jgi:translation initiation factor 2B subunit (eIF-2B alpha/beta/delta family)